jgi:acetyl-CoA carboxylase biotin carboxyl carrier protein
MDFDEINRILDIVREHDLSEFELEREGFKIRIKKGGTLHAVPQSGSPQVPHGTHPAPEAAGMASPQAVPEAAAETESGRPATDEVDFAIVKSPIVGTFFRASEPGAAPFVEVGDTVRTGQVLCIIEAMKLMNEIESEYDGELVKVYVENGQPVQYGERLFAIKAQPNV